MDNKGDVKKINLRAVGQHLVFWPIFLIVCAIAALLLFLLAGGLQQ